VEDGTTRAVPAQLARQDALAAHPIVIGLTDPPGPRGRRLPVPAEAGIIPSHPRPSPPPKDPRTSLPDALAAPDRLGRDPAWGPRHTGMMGHGLGGRAPRAAFFVLRPRITGDKPARTGTAAP
jgi:hypothetical protein